MAQERTLILAQRHVDEARVQVHAAHPDYSIRVTSSLRH